MGKISIILNIISFIVLFFAVKNLIQYQKSKGTKYEFKLYEGSEYMVNNSMPRLQSEGWEIAGSITTKYSNNFLNENRMLIPLKRKLK